MDRAVPQWRRNSLHSRRVADQAFCSDIAITSVYAWRMNKTTTMQIRLTTAEKKLLKANAVEQGLTVATLVRLALLNSNLKFITRTLVARKKAKP